MKECNKCNQLKEYAAFHKDSARSDELHIYCKACRKGYADAYELDGRRKAKQYGISVEELNKLLLDKCYICKSDEDLVIDHDHSCCNTTRTCGKCVRGMLCTSCNIGLGMFKDNPDLLIIASEYLKLKKL
jgi:hypothetical protein